MWWWRRSAWRTCEDTPTHVNIYTLCKALTQEGERQIYMNTEAHTHCNQQLPPCEHLARAHTHTFSLYQHSPCPLQLLCITSHISPFRSPREKQSDSLTQRWTARVKLEKKCILFVYFKKYATFNAVCVVHLQQVKSSWQTGFGPRHYSKH